jgi:hypothetical protein
MWKIIQELIPWFLVILIFSQYVIPVVLDQETWWLFKLHRKKQKPELTQEKPLEDEVDKTKELVKETKEKVIEVKKKVDR